VVEEREDFVGKPLLVILLGPPGSGKGTQAKRLTTLQPTWSHVSTGDLFRKEIASKSELGLKVSEVIAQGKLVSDDLTGQIFESQLFKIIKEKSPAVILLDGYPRNAVQSAHILKLVESSQFPTPRILELDVPESAVLERLGGRLVNAKTGKVYHSVYSPPKVPGVCDEDGSKLIQRPDDRPETIKSRYALYQKERSGIVEGLKKGRIESVKVSGTRAPEEIEQELEKKIKSWI
jgi:adenylate kinase